MQASSMRHARCLQRPHPLQPSCNRAAQAIPITTVHHGHCDLHNASSAMFSTLGITCPSLDAPCTLAIASRPQPKDRATASPTSLRWFPRLSASSTPRRHEDRPRWVYRGLSPVRTIWSRPLMHTLGGVFAPSKMHTVTRGSWHHRSMASEHDDDAIGFSLSCHFKVLPSSFGNLSQDEKPRPLGCEARGGAPSCSWLFGGPLGMIVDTSLLPSLTKSRLSSRTVS